MAPRGPGALRGRTGRRGRGALASWGARAGRAPVPGPARGAGPGLRGRRALISVVFAVLLPVLSASAITTELDRGRQQLTASQALRRSPSNKWCPAGSYLSEYTGDCVSCIDGVDFTSHANNNSACIACLSCGLGQEEIAPCTTTRNTECQCKRGTYQDKDSTEACKKCSTKCPKGKVIASNCTSQNDLQCVDQESSIQASEESPVTKESVTTSPGPPTTPSPSSGNLRLEIGLPIGFLIVLLVLTILACSCYYRRRILQACGVDPERVDRVCFWRSCPPRGSVTRDNAHNQNVSNRNTQSTLDSEQQLEQQEHVELAPVSTESPEEPERQLGPAAGRVSDENQAAISSNGVGPQCRSCY